MAPVTELLSIRMTLAKVLNPIAFFLQPSRRAPLEIIAAFLDDVTAR
jgi:hypothetical protein